MEYVASRTPINGIISDAIMSYRAIVCATAYLPSVKRAPICFPGSVLNYFVHAYAYLAHASRVLVSGQLSDGFPVA